MKILLLLALIQLSTAAKLNNQYLPPDTAKTAGGDGTILDTPKNPFEEPQYGGQNNRGNIPSRSGTKTNADSYTIGITGNTKTKPVYGPSSPSPLIPGSRIQGSQPTEYPIPSGLSPPNRPGLIQSTAGQANTERIPYSGQNTFGTSETSGGFARPGSVGSSGVNGKFDQGSYNGQNVAGFPSGERVPTGSFGTRTESSGVINGQQPSRPIGSQPTGQLSTGTRIQPGYFPGTGSASFEGGLGQSEIYQPGQSDYSQGQRNQGDQQVDYQGNKPTVTVNSYQNPVDDYSQNVQPTQPTPSYSNDLVNQNRLGGGSGVAPFRQPFGTASFGSGGTVIEQKGLGQTRDALAKTLKYFCENNGDGSYRFEFETDNGIYREESGEFIPSNNPESGEEIVRGSYSYVAPDGKTYTVKYTADANGFHPEGDHLPTPPPTPEAILRALAQLKSQNQNEQITQNGQASYGNRFRGNQGRTNEASDGQYEGRSNDDEFQLGVQDGSLTQSAGQNRGNQNERSGSDFSYENNQQSGGGNIFNDNRNEDSQRTNQQGTTGSINVNQGNRGYFNGQEANNNGQQLQQQQQQQSIPTNNGYSYPQDTGKLTSNARINNGFDQQNKQYDQNSGIGGNQPYQKPTGTYQQQNNQNQYTQNQQDTSNAGEEGQFVQEQPETRTTSNYEGRNQYNQPKTEDGTSSSQYSNNQKTQQRGSSRNQPETQQTKGGYSGPDETNTVTQDDGYNYPKPSGETFDQRQQPYDIDRRFQSGKKGINSIKTQNNQALGTKVSKDGQNFGNRQPLNNGRQQLNGQSQFINRQPQITEKQKETFGNDKQQAIGQRQQTFNNGKPQTVRNENQQSFGNAGQQRIDTEDQQVNNGNGIQQQPFNGGNQQSFIRQNPLNGGSRLPENDQDLTNNYNNNYQNTESGIQTQYEPQKNTQVDNSLSYEQQDTGNIDENQTKPDTRSGNANQVRTNSFDTQTRTQTAQKEIGKVEQNENGYYYPTPTQNFDREEQGVQSNQKQGYDGDANGGNVKGQKKPQEKGYNYQGDAIQSYNNVKGQRKPTQQPSTIDQRFQSDKINDNQVGKRPINKPINRPTTQPIYRPESGSQGSNQNIQGDANDSNFNGIKGQVKPTQQLSTIDQRFQSDKNGGNQQSGIQQNYNTNKNKGYFYPRPEENKFTDRGVGLTSNYNTNYDLKHNINNGNKFNNNNNNNNRGVTRYQSTQTEKSPINSFEKLDTGMRLSDTKPRPFERKPTSGYSTDNELVKSINNFMEKYDQIDSGSKGKPFRGNGRFGDEQTGVNSQNPGQASYPSQDFTKTVKNGNNAVGSVFPGKPGIKYLPTNDDEEESKYF